MRRMLIVMGVLLLLVVGALVTRACQNKAAMESSVKTWRFVGNKHRDAYFTYIWVSHGRGGHPVPILMPARDWSEW